MSSDNVARVFLAAKALAAVIVVVTVAGALRILTVVPDGENELRGWLAAGVVLAGFTVATVVVTCGEILKALDRRVGAAAGPSTDVDPAVATPEPPDYVT